MLSPQHDHDRWTWTVPAATHTHTKLQALYWHWPSLSLFTALWWGAALFCQSRLKPETWGRKKTQNKTQCPLLQPHCQDEQSPTTNPCIGTIVKQETDTSSILFMSLNLATAEESFSGLFEGDANSAKLWTECLDVASLWIQTKSCAGIVSV